MRKGAAGDGAAQPELQAPQRADELAFFPPSPAGRHRQPVAIASLSPSHAVLFDATIMIIDQPAATA